ncbi:Poly(A)+ RNA export protein [Dendryphion nanum]|uniref:Poly(A)+ RNA export protein n=1 Tax=Dendryphion nanum TaxID=256645 RepID=A0A9P9DSA3_9PLEO|nr:Poly(A)+ RNA export protein [Dendryphion nanum]
MAFLNSAAQQAASSTTGDTSKDVEIPADATPSDSISDLMFSPTNDHLAVASWDGSVRIFEINVNGVQPKWMFKCEGPVLCVAWSKDGMRVAAGDTQKKAYQHHPPGEVQAQQFIAHQDAVKCVRWTETNGSHILITGSWDKTIMFWDLSTQDKPQGMITCQERVYTMDVKDKLLVIGTAERHIHMVDLNSPTTIAKTITSPLKWQTRVVSCFSDASGFAVGSIEGRCAIQYVKEDQANLNFSFKCHRQTDSAQRDIAKVYSVNAISFHPQHGTFSTAGSDGTFHFWDKDAKHRLKGYPETGGSITATGFSRNGDIFAYAVSYDWSKGYSGNTANYPIKIKLHPIVGDECKPRPGTKKR